MQPFCFILFINERILCTEFNIWRLIFSNVHIQFDWKKVLLFEHPLVGIVIAAEHWLSEGGK